MAGHSLLSSTTTTARTTAEVARMGLERFASARLVVTVHSSLLEETVLFVSDNAAVAASETRRIFRAGDLERFLRSGESPATPTSRTLAAKVA